MPLQTEYKIEYRFDMKKDWRKAKLTHSEMLQQDYFEVC